MEAFPQGYMVAIVVTKVHRAQKHDYILTAEQQKHENNAAIIAHSTVICMDTKYFSI